MNDINFVPDGCVTLGQVGGSAVTGELLSCTDNSRLGSLRIAGPSVAYGLLIEPAVVADNGCIIGEDGLERFVAHVREAWANGKVFVLTGTARFRPASHSDVPA